MQNTVIDCKHVSQEKITGQKLPHEKLQHVEELAAELKQLLKRHSAVLNEEGIRKQMERLEQWLESQQKGAAPAHIVSETGLSWLSELRDHLKLSAEEMQRLEGEGGNPASPEQAARIEELNKTVRRIENIICHSSATHTH